MKNNKYSLISDVSFVALLILLFISVMFIAMLGNEQAASLTSAAALCVIFAVMIVTHFTSITTGLIINAVLIFAYASWLLYKMIVLGNPITSEAYFWIIMSPLMTVATAIIFRQSHSLDEENIELKHQMLEYVTVDSHTDLKNKRAYENEMTIYRHLAHRYNKQLLLIVWEFRYEAEMKRLVGAEKFDEVAVAISHAMENVFRKEDVLYLFSDAPYRWGTLMLTDVNYERQLMGRLRKSIEELDVKKLVGKHAPKLEVRIGAEYDADDIETPLQLLEKAIAQIQYDV